MPFDPYAQALLDDPYPTYAVLRQTDPVHYAPAHHLWVLSRHADVLAAVRNWQDFSSTGGVELADPLFGPGDLIVNDPPRHDVLRSLVTRHFHARRVQALRPVLHRHCESLIRGHAANAADSRGTVTFDVVREYADRIPGTTMCVLLGLPQQDAPWITRKVHEMMVRTNDSTVRTQGLAAKDALWAYFTQHLHAFERRRPDETAGEHGSILMDLADACRRGVLAEDEVPGLCLSLMSAGTETTTALISTTMWRLANGTLSPTPHAAPDSGRAAGLLVDGDVDVRALDEILRLDSPIQWLTRMTTTDVTMSGVRIPCGSRVILLFASANRDPSVFRSPDTLDASRDQSQSLAFGQGIHFCLGRLLSRIESQVALGTFLRHFAVSGLAGVPERFPSAWLRGFTHLPLVMTRQ